MTRTCRDSQSHTHTHRERGMPPKRRVIDESDSDEEGDVDVNDQLQSMFSKPKEKKGPPRKRAKPAESSDDSSDDSEFDDGYDANFMGDEADRAYLNGLTDLKRSKILFKREEERHKKKELWELKRSLKAREKGTTVKNRRGSAAGSTPKNKQASALSQIRASRSQKKQNEIARNNVKKRPEFRSSESESSSSSEDVDDDDSDDAWGPSRSTKKKGRRDDLDEVRDDTEAEDEPIDKADLVPVTYDEINKIRVSRNRLERWIEEPFLESTVAGAFVRVLIGNNSGRPIYRLCEIVKVTEYKRRDRKSVV